MAQYVFYDALFPYCFWSWRVIIRFKEMISLIEAQPEMTRPQVDKVFPFDSAIDAFAYLESQQHVGKVVIKVAS